MPRQVPDRGQPTSILVKKEVKDFAFFIKINGVFNLGGVSKPQSSA